MSSAVSTDPIADMLTRIRNAIHVRQSEVSLPHSTLKAAIAKLLKTNGFILDSHISGEGVNRTLTMVLNSEHGNSPITEISRLSRPGRRHYVQAKEIPAIKHGRGIVIISTSKGLMTGSEAKAKRLGGELICGVY